MSLGGGRHDWATASPGSLPPLPCEGFRAGLAVTSYHILSSLSSLAIAKVGCGGGRGKADATKSGSFLVLKSENLALRHEAKVKPILKYLPQDFVTAIVRTSR